MEKSETRTIIIVLVITAISAIVGHLIFTNNGQADLTSNHSPKSEISTIDTHAQTPQKETKIETKTEIITFETQTISDSSLEYGKTEVKAAGANGETTYTYEVEYENGKEVSRKLINKTVTKQPITKIIAKGTKVIWRCVDVTSYDKNPYNDNRCTSSTGEVRYVSDSVSRSLDPTYRPGTSGHYYYNSK